MAIGKKTTKTAPKKKTTTKIAIIGSGEVTAKAVKSLLTDHVESLDGEVSFILPITKEHFGDGMKHVADFLISNDTPYEAITNAAGAKARALKPYLTNATETFAMERGLVRKFFTLMSGADAGELIVLLAEDEEDGSDTDIAVTKAFEAEIPVLDMCQGLQEIEAGDDDDKEDDEEEDDEDDKESDDEEEDDDDEAPKAKSKKSSKAKDDDDEEEEDVADIDIDALATIVAKKLAKVLATV